MKQTYKPYTLVGPTVTRPEQDPLAVVNLDNRLYMRGCVFFLLIKLPTSLLALLFFRGTFHNMFQTRHDTRCKVSDMNTLVDS